MLTDCWSNSSTPDEDHTLDATFDADVVAGEGAGVERGDVVDGAEPGELVGVEWCCVRSETCGVHRVGLDAVGEDASHVAGDREHPHPGDRHGDGDDREDRPAATA